MPIKNIRWTCPNCKSEINMDKPLPITRDFDYDEFKETKKVYQKQYKLYQEDKQLIDDKWNEFKKIVDTHNTQFWQNKWQAKMFSDCIEIRIASGTKWYKFGKGVGKLVKQYNIENKKPYEFENISYGIECPVCHKIDITKSETIDLSKE